MDKSSIKKRFIKKIYEELQEYKNSILKQSTEIVYGESYRIEIISTLYEILLEKADSISDTVLLSLLEQSTGILEMIYQDWLKKEDSSYQELVEHVDKELEQKYV